MKQGRLKLLVVVALAALCALGAKAQEHSFTTLAGLSGNWSNTDGQGSAARFYTPHGLVLDGAGNLYVADTYNETIRKVTPAGLVSTLAGGAGIRNLVDGPAASARFWDPTGVAVDQTGNLYISDRYTIRVLNPSGVVTTLAGQFGTVRSVDGTGTAAGFKDISGIVLDGGGNLYVVESGSSLVRKVSLTGIVTTLAGNADELVGPGSADGTGSAALFRYPGAIATDNQGNLYVADTGNHTIRRVTLAGAVTTIAGSAGNAGNVDGLKGAARFNTPSGIAVDGAGNLWVGDNANQTIRKITPGGLVSTAGGAAGVVGHADGVGAAATFGFPTCMAADGAGNIYIADTANNTIRKGSVALLAPTVTSQKFNRSVSVGGTTTFSVTAKGSAPLSYQWLRNGAVINGATNATFTVTKTTLADYAGYSVVVRNAYGQTTNQVGVLAVAPSSYSFTTYAGATPATVDGPRNVAKFDYPGGMGVDGLGNVYVTGDGLVRKIAANGQVTTIAGGENSSAVAVNWPADVVGDATGTIYAVDNANATILKITPSGSLSILAGSAGVVGSSDGAGSTARFNYPVGITLDKQGTIYVADTLNQLIRKVTPAGEVTTIAGAAGIVGSADGAGGAARFNNPGNLAVDGAGNLYVADTGNWTIRKITSTGEVTTLLTGGFGPATEGSSVVKVEGVRGIVSTTTSDLYVTSEHAILKVTPAGQTTTFAGDVNNYGSTDGAGPVALFYYPNDLVIDGAGNFFVADTDNHSIRMITPTGVVTTYAGGGAVHADGNGLNARFSGPIDVAQDGLGNSFVVDVRSDGFNAIRKIDAGGSVTTLAQVHNANGITADASGNIYVTQSSSWTALGHSIVSGPQTVLKINSAGVVTLVAGSYDQIGNGDGIGGAARFRKPSGIALDDSGNLYVADTANNSIRKITSAGLVSTFAGVYAEVGSVVGNVDGTNSAARFGSPSSMAVDQLGNVFVTDSQFHTIRKITPTGMVTTVAGWPGAPGSSDGVGSAARFNAPARLAIDDFNNLYVADSGNHTIRKITPNWEVSTLGGLSGSPGSQDGVDRVARFNGPSGIAVDASGTLYIADSFNHTIRVGQPLGVPVLNPLQIVLAGSEVVVSWPTNLAGFGLESSPGFLPGATWTPMTTGIATVADRYLVTNQVGVAARYYRLKK